MSFTDYMIVDCASVNELNDAVRAMLKLGYTPLGGPLAYQSDNLPGFCQAMVKCGE